MMNSRELSEKIAGDGLSQRFLEIYIDEAHAMRQKKRYLNAIAAFEHFYGESQIGIFSAPGRTEIGGNHTDHQNGEVLAASVNRDVLGIVQKTGDHEVRVVSGNHPMVSVDLGDLSMRIREAGTTVSIVRGVLASIRKRGYEVGGLQIYITSDVRIGAGLSSSAAFETLLATAESVLYNEGAIPAEEIAMIGRYAENIYFGKPCGLMDQMTCSVGSLVHIDFKKPEKPLVEKLSFDFAAHGYVLCITDTKSSHADLTEDYAEVPAEMRSVAAYFGKTVLRDVSEETVLRDLAGIRKKNGDRALLRALHFYEENKRVRLETEALKNGDIEAFLDAVRASGASSFQYLQNVYTTRSIREQNVAVALQLSGIVLGAGEKRSAYRVHGGGFAGTIQAWVPSGQAKEYRERMNELLGEHSCEILQIRNFGGMQVV